MDGQLRAHGDYTAEKPESNSIAVAGTFTLNLFRERLAAHPFSEAFRDRVTYSGYGQLAQFLLTAPEVGTVVLLVRWEDWFRHSGETADGGRSLHSAVREFTGQLESFRARRTSRVLLIVCPSPSDGRAPGGEAEAAVAEEELARLVARLPAVTVAWADGWAGELDTGQVHDPYLDRLAHLPYTETFFSVLADRVAALLAAGGTRPPGAGARGGTEWADAPRPTAPPDRTFRRLVDEAGDLRAGTGGTGILSLAWRPWLTEDKGDSPGTDAGPGWAVGARTLDAVLGDLAAALRTFRLRSDRPLLITVPPPEHVPSPLTNLFAHAEDSLCRISAEMTDVTVAWASSRDSSCTMARK